MGDHDLDHEIDHEIGFHDLFRELSIVGTTFGDRERDR